MNNTTYIFGNFWKTYTQFPDDYTSRIFTTFAMIASKKSQMVIHRDGDLMYYSYIHTLTGGNNQYLGFCILLNGALVKDMHALFTLFEDNLKAIILSDKNLLVYDSYGLRPATASLADHMEMLMKISRDLSNSFADRNIELDVLPPQNNSVSQNSTAILSYFENNNLIVSATAKYSYVCVTKADGCDLSEYISSQTVHENSSACTTISNNNDKGQQTNSIPHTNSSNTTDFNPYDKGITNNRSNYYRKQSYDAGPGCLDSLFDLFEGLLKAAGVLIIIAIIGCVIIGSLL